MVRHLDFLIKTRKTHTHKNVRECTRMCMPYSLLIVNILHYQEKIIKEMFKKKIECNFKSKILKISLSSNKIL